MQFIGKRDIYGRNGDLYLRRFTFGRLMLHIIYRPDEDEDCHDHRWDFVTFPLTPYVEVVINPKVIDNLETAHRIWHENLILPPSKKTSRVEIVPAFKFSKRRANHTHRILGRWNGYSESRYGHTFTGKPRTEEDTPQVGAGPIVTLVWRSAPYRDWGFVKNRGNLWCWQFWKDYLSGGRHGGCE